MVPRSGPSKRINRMVKQRTSETVEIDKLDSSYLKKGAVSKCEYIIILKHLRRTFSMQSRQRSPFQTGQQSTLQEVLRRQYQAWPLLAFHSLILHVKVGPSAKKEPFERCMYYTSCRGNAAC